MDNPSLNRYLRNMLLLARIADIDHARDRYRVDIDGPSGSVRSGWLHRLTSRAGDGAETWHYSVGEQVLVAALTQNLEVGVVLGAINQAAHPPASTEAGIYRQAFADGTIISYDANEGVLTVDAVNDIEVQVGGDVTINVTGNAEVMATQIKLNDGAGVVTGESRCHFNGLPHADCSTVVFAGKDPV